MLYKILSLILWEFRLFLVLEVPKSSFDYQDGLYIDNFEYQGLCLAENKSIVHDGALKLLDGKFGSQS